MRVALVAGMYAPYRVPVWEQLGRRFGELTVFLSSEVESNRVWQREDTTGASFQMRVLPGVHRHVGALDYGFHFNPTLLRELKALKPDALILSGWDTPTYVTALGWARVKGVPVVLLIESHSLSSRVHRGPVAVARRTIARAADAIVAHGRAGTAYMRELGVKPERVVTGMLAVDVDRFARIADAARAGANGRVPGRPRFLYVGQLIERKGIRELLAAFEAMSPDEAELTIVGHGPLEAEVVERAAKLEHVTFAGASHSVDETARHYAASDVFVMPSHREVWGLVLNEALASGLYVLSGRAAGATPDMVEDAPFDVGRSIDPADPAELLAAVRDAARGVREGAHDRDRIAQWGRSFTVERLADAIVAAVDVARRRHRPAA